MGESRTAPTIKAIRESASCIVTVACQYCQPLKSPLGIVVPTVRVHAQPTGRGAKPGVGKIPNLPQRFPAPRVYRLSAVR